MRQRLWILSSFSQFFILNSLLHCLYSLDSNLSNLIVFSNFFFISRKKMTNNYNPFYRPLCIEQSWRLCGRLCLARSDKSSHCTMKEREITLILTIVLIKQAFDYPILLAETAWIKYNPVKLEISWVFDILMHIPFMILFWNLLREVKEKVSVRKPNSDYS